MYPGTPECMPCLLWHLYSGVPGYQTWLRHTRVCTRVPPVYTLQNIPLQNLQYLHAVYAQNICTQHLHAIFAQPRAYAAIDHEMNVPRIANNSDTYVHTSVIGNITKGHLNGHKRFPVPCIFDQTDRLTALPLTGGGVVSCFIHSHCL